MPCLQPDEMFAWQDEVSSKLVVLGNAKKRKHSKMIFYNNMKLS
jgi:hypothetical protein